MVKNVIQHITQKRTKHTYFVISWSSKAQYTVAVVALYSTASLDLVDLQCIFASPTLSYTKVFSVRQRLVYNSEFT